MSTGLNCELTEVEPGKWYYVLEHGSAPKQSWDWREYASAYGPFKSEDAANEHLSRHHANPGGQLVECYDAARQIDDVMAKLIADAPKNMNAPRF